MKKLQFYLSGFLALQLVLAVGLYWNQVHQQAQQQRSEALVAVVPDEIQRVEIRGDKKSLTLVKQGDKWQLPDMHKLPADGAKLRALLAKLGNLRGNWPVATTSSAQERFEVAKDKFRKRLRLYGSGDKVLAELYVGTSPGFRKVNVRRAGEDAIYSVSLNSYELPVADDSWLDKSLLAAGPVKAISGPDYQLAKHGDKWQFSHGDADLDTTKAAALASALAELRVTRAADKVPDGEHVTLQVSAGGGKLNYTFTKADKHCYVARSDRQQAFEISSGDYQRIAALRNQQLVMKPAGDAERTADGKTDKGKAAHS
ncbi:DUF4340 domain-containing protein [Microbulbifer sp. SAOS-129_SWC]|uniref:DUF4340 domain-containing protein n=1 Tax=Microbulbifer sp. SAOS-129_SWC TaxID=3145235 RepID=UPI003217BF32